MPTKVYDITKTKVLFELSDKISKEMLSRVPDATGIEFAGAYACADGIVILVNVQTKGTTTITLMPVLMNGANTSEIPPEWVHFWRHSTDPSKIMTMIESIQHVSGTVQPKEGIRFDPRPILPAVKEPKEKVRSTAKTPDLRGHGTYVHDHPWLSKVSDLTVEEAYAQYAEALQTFTPWVEAQEDWKIATFEEFKHGFLNKMFRVIRQEGASVNKQGDLEGKLFAIYNHDGRWSLWSCTFLAFIHYCKQCHRSPEPFWPVIPKKKEEASCAV